MGLKLIHCPVCLWCSLVQRKPGPGLNPGISKRRQGNRAAPVCPLRPLLSHKLHVSPYWNSILKAAGRVFQKNWIGMFWGSWVTLLPLSICLCKYTSAWLWADVILRVRVWPFYLFIYVRHCWKYECTVVVLPTRLRPDFVPVTSLAMRRLPLSSPSQQSKISLCHFKSYIMHCSITRRNELDACT